MAYANATKAQKQELRDRLINCTKMVERVQEFGQPGLASQVDTALAATKAAIDAVVNASSGT